jgi:hypothetical protein
VRLPVWMRHRAADFGRRLVLAQALVNDLPQQVVVLADEASIVRGVRVWHPRLS